MLLMTLILTSTLVYSVMWRPGAGAFPTTLILKPESCAQLAHQDIAINSVSPADNTCSVIVPFRADPLSHGGAIYLQGMSFNLAAEQLIAQKLIDEPAAVQSRFKDLMMIFACSVCLLGSLAWAFKANNGCRAN